MTRHLLMLRLPMATKGSYGGLKEAGNWYLPRDSRADSTFVLSGNFLI